MVSPPCHNLPICSVKNRQIPHCYLYPGSGSGAQPQRCILSNDCMNGWWVLPHSGPCALSTGYPTAFMQAGTQELPRKGCMVARVRHKEQELLLNNSRRKQKKDEKKWMRCLK